MKIKGLGWLLFGFTFGLYAVLVFGMFLPYTYANTDIVLYTSVLPEILDALMDVTEIAVFAIGFGICMYACFHRASITQKLCLMGILSGAVIFRRVCDLSVSLIVFSVIGIEDILDCVIYLILELILIWGIFLLIQSIASRYFKKTALLSKASALFDNDFTPTVTVKALYPFPKIYSKENPMQVCALISGIVLSAVKVISRIIFDISYGAPEGIQEILVMIVYYGSDIVLGILYYIGVLFLLTRLFKRKDRHNKRDNKEESGEELL